MTNPFHAGQEVVCIVDFGEWLVPYNWPIALPKKNATYVVSHIAKPFRDGTAAIGLVGFNPDVSLEVCAFRPLVKTDISSLEALLVPATKVLEPA